MDVALGSLAAGVFEYDFGDAEVVMVAYLMMAAPFIIQRVAGERLRD